MKTSIVPIQSGTSTVVPKPTQAQLIEAMAFELQARNIEENKRRDIIRQKLKAKMVKECEKMKKRSVRLADLQVKWDYAGARVCIIHQTIAGTPSMVDIQRELDKVAPLTEDLYSLREEIKSRLNKEAISGILSQPGVKDAIQSAFIKLNL